MSLSLASILNRVRRSRRIMYGDFAPWEMDDDDPRQAEFQASPEDEEKHFKSLSFEKRDPDYLLNDYLPKNFGLNHDQVVRMASRYMDQHKMVQGYRRYLKEDLSYDTPEIKSMRDLIKHHLANGFDNSNIIGTIGGYIGKINHSENLHDHLTHNARLFKITGKI